jgi:hypothetical protein
MVAVRVVDVLAFAATIAAVLYAASPGDPVPLAPIKVQDKPHTSDAFDTGAKGVDDMSVVSGTLSQDGCLGGGGCVIAVIAYDRPEYFSRVLDSLSAAKGIEHYDVLMHLEPGNAEVLRLAESFSAARRVEVTVNATVLGCHANKKSAIAAAFARPSAPHFVILVEDDTLLSSDALRFFEWAASEYAEDREIFTVSAYGDSAHRPGETVGAQWVAAVGRRKHYTPWAWGIWRDRWEDIEGLWSGWDVQFNFWAPTKATVDWTRRHEGLRRGRKEVFPLLSRSNNIGWKGGTHAENMDPDTMKEVQFLHDWAGGSEKADTGVEFYEISGRETLDACASVPFGEDTARGFC